MTTVRSDRAVWPPLTIFLLTLVWLVGVAATFLRVLFVDYVSPDATHGWSLLFFGWLAAGPVVIAGVATAIRLRRTAVVYAVLAVPLVCYSLTVGGRDWLNPPPPAPPPPTTEHCVEYSGGDTRCPGG